MTKEAYIKTSEVIVSAVPFERKMFSLHFSVNVQWRGTKDGEDLYAVHHGKMPKVLNREGDWVYESVPSERSDDLIAQTRFPLQEAIEMASRVVHDLRVNGITAEEAMQHDDEMY